MKLARLSIDRPIFMSCILACLLIVGLMSFKKLPVDLFPDVTFPVVTVTTTYPGAGPKEIETLVSKPLEEELSTVSGVKTIRSINSESISTVVAEFTLETDVKYAEQQVRDRVTSAKRKLPDEIDEPIIRRIDPADQPILIISLTANAEPGQIYDLANEVIRPKIEQLPQVGRVEIIGGRKREIHITLDRSKMMEHQISVSQVAERIRTSGQNIPAGKVTQKTSDMVFRTLGEFKSVQQIRDTIVNFLGNDVAVSISDLGTVQDTLKDENSRAYFNGKQSLYLNVFKQTGANTIAVADNVKKRIGTLNTELKQSSPFKPELNLVRNTSRFIRDNILDVYESIGIGIVLTIIVVFFFLGNIRSTLITGLAIPVSLIGAMTFLSSAGFSINIMSLLAFSLAVGLLIDDAIVVRENIFRHMEMGKSSKKAAYEGTTEVGLAVIAVTLAIIAVFGPIGFLSGVVGQFFKQFGLSVCFIMAVSLFDALSNAPMMSAYFGGKPHQKATRGIMAAFERFQVSLEKLYGRILDFVLLHPAKVLIITFITVILGFGSLKFVPKTFLPAQDNGEFSIGLDMDPGTSLQRMDEVSKQIDAVVRKHPAVVNTILIVGDQSGQANKATFFVNLKAFKERTQTTTQVKMDIRESLKPFAFASPTVKDIDAVGGGQRPFNVNIIGQDLAQVEGVAVQLLKKLKSHPGLLDPDSSSRSGKPEYQVAMNLRAAEKMGVSTALVGQELRANVEGMVPAVFRESGLEYDIRVRMREEQRDLEKEFSRIFVPNINGRMIRLSNVASGIKTEGPATINRENRGRYVQIAADITPGGPGMGGVIDDINAWFKSGEIKLPEGVTYRFVGQAENFQELLTSMLTAAGLGILFIYLVLASLYESLMTPFAIMIVIPLAIVGGFVALAVTQSSLDLFSMIACIMLMGLATKNSIILVDYINQLTRAGESLQNAIRKAGNVRLRPILMTSLALIAGMIPVAIGLNEASSQRRSLGIAIIGGVVSSTLLTLIVIPAIYQYLEALRRKLISWTGHWVTKSED